jgi:hypothetical protein
VSTRRPARASSFVFRQQAVNCRSTGRRSFTARHEQLPMSAIVRPSEVRDPLEGLGSWVPDEGTGVHHALANPDPECFEFGLSGGTHC